MSAWPYLAMTGAAALAAGDVKRDWLQGELDLDRIAPDGRTVHLKSGGCLQAFRLSGQPYETKPLARQEELLLGREAWLNALGEKGVAARLFGVKREIDASADADWPSPTLREVAAAAAEVYRRSYEIAWFVVLAAGARWDRAAKAWFAPGGADRTPLAAWDSLGGKAPENVTTPPQVEFAQACRDHGLVVRDVAMDGQWHRVPVKGDKGQRTSGSYRGYLDGRPNGQISNFREDGTIKWVATGQALTPETRENLRAEAANKRQDRDADRERAWAAAAKKAFGVWSNAPPAKADAPYLQSRAVGAHGLRAGDGDRLIVPVRDADGALMSLQFIAPDGKKRLMAGGRKDGGMHVIAARGGAKDGPIVVAEGYATAAALGEASGHAAVCAFDAGNLKAVAEALRAKHPQRTIILAADDDRAKRGRGNVGLNRAREAAQAVDGKVVEPGFTDAERAKGMTDFNDLARARGADAVRAALAPALAGDRKRAAAPARPAEDARALAMAQ